MFAFFLFTGSGMYVVGIGFFSLLFMQLGINKLIHDGYYEAHGWPKMLALWIAAVLTWLLCEYLEENDEELRIGGRLILRYSRSTMFLVPIRFWPILFVVLGIVALFI